MIKTFRNIRLKLLSEGKTKKYLKYAIGEIALVVIGILIVLQINNWNQQRIEKRKEQAILKRLTTELKSNHKQLLERLKVEMILIKTLISNELNQGEAYTTMAVIKENRNQHE